MPALAIIVLPVPVGTVTSTLCPATIALIACSWTGYGCSPFDQKNLSTKASSRSCDDGAATLRRCHGPCAGRNRAGDQGVAGWARSAQNGPPTSSATANW